METQFIDRRGRELQIRPLGPDDAAGLCALTRILLEDGRGMVMTPEEARDEEGHAKMLTGLEERGDLHLGAFDGSTLIGTVDILRIQRTLLRHNAQLGMGIAPSHQDAGLGRRLLELGLSWADTHGIERIELYVRDDNPRARSLYTRAGFVPIHLRTAFVKLPDGRAIGDWLMERLAPRGS